MCSEHGNHLVYLHLPQQNHPVSSLHEPLHWKVKRDPKANMISLQSFLRKGVSLGYVGSIKNLKELNDLKCVSLGYVGENYNLKDLNAKIPGRYQIEVDIGYQIQVNSATPEFLDVHSAEFASFVASDVRGSSDQICTT